MKIVLIFSSVLFFLSFLLFLCFGFSNVKAATIDIDGTKVSCAGAHVRMDRDLDNLGETDLNSKQVVLNPRAMSRFSKTVKLFVFYHECGHLRVGANEFAADCWAVNQGVQEGWLTASDLPKICDSWGGLPETDTHPSAARRCGKLNKCFRSITASKPIPPKKDTVKTDENAYGFKPENK